MGKNSRIRAKKVHARKVAHLAAYSRQFTVKNNVIGTKTKEITLGKDCEPIKVTVQRGKMYYQAPFHQKYQVYGSVGGHLFEITEKPDKYGLHFHLVEEIPWKHEHYKQPKRLIKCKKHNDFVELSKNYPYTLPKMNKVQYMEKLVEHKLAKWERKNPKPMDMFTDDVEKWKQERETVKERFRDFVVSIYDKLLLTGRFKIGSSGMSTYQEKKVAEIKDINGEGHKVNELGKNSKLLKKAQKITNDTHAKHANLMCTNLRDHKRQKGRIILPQAA